MLFLGAIAYQIYKLTGLLATKPRERNIEDVSNFYTTLCPVFSERDIQYHQEQYIHFQTLVEKNFELLRETERKELLEHKTKGGTAETFVPSRDLIACIKNLEDNVLNRENRQEYVRKMIMANIAVLNGDPIDLAHDKAITAYPTNAALHSPVIVENRTKVALSERQEYWKDLFDTVDEDDE